MPYVWVAVQSYPYCGALSSKAASACMTCSLSSWRHQFLRRSQPTAPATSLCTWKPSIITSPSFPPPPGPPWEPPWLLRLSLQASQR